MKHAVFSAIEAMLRFALPSQYNDWILRARQKHHVGVLPLTAKVAIYLVFPTHGILPSHLQSLRHIMDNGYSPLVISNAALSDADIQVLQPLSWKVIERVNFGYDFGGYRDGVIEVFPHSNTLQRLVLLNDSCWFPIHGCKNWLAEAEASGSDVYAANLVGEIDGFSLNNFATAVAKQRISGRRLHYGSFALSFGPRAIQHAGFARFWRRLRLTQGKGRTVRRGEQGFSKWLRRTELSHEAMSHSLPIWAEVKGMPASKFNQLWQYLMVAARSEIYAIHRELSNCSGEDQLNTKKQFVGLHLSWAGAQSNIPHYMVINHRYPFLKKATFDPNGPNAKTLAAIIKDLDDPAGPEMLAEHIQRYPMI